MIDVGVDPATGKRRQQRKAGFRTRKAAEEALRNVIAEVEAGTHVTRSGMTLGAYLDQWLETVEGRTRLTTSTSYEVAARRVKTHLGAVPLQSLTPLQVERFYGILAKVGGERGRPLAPKTIRNTHTVLRKALGDAERLGLVSRNAAAAAHPPAGERKEQRTWSAAEVREFLTIIEGHRLYAAFLLLATTGMRRGEVLGLRWSDVDL